MNMKVRDHDQISTTNMRVGTSLEKPMLSLEWWYNTVGVGRYGKMEMYIMEHPMEHLVTAMGAHKWCAY